MRDVPPLLVPVWLFRRSGLFFELVAVTLRYHWKLSS